MPACQHAESEHADDAHRDADGHTQHHQREHAAQSPSNATHSSVMRSPGGAGGGVDHGIVRRPTAHQVPQSGMAASSSALRWHRQAAIMLKGTSGRRNPEIGRGLRARWPATFTHDHPGHAAAETPSVMATACQSSPDADGWPRPGAPTATSTQMWPAPERGHGDAPEQRRCPAAGLAPSNQSGIWVLTAATLRSSTLPDDQQVQSAKQKNGSHRLHDGRGGSLRMGAGSGVRRAQYVGVADLASSRLEVHPEPSCAGQHRPFAAVCRPLDSYTGCGSSLPGLSIWAVH